MFMQEAESSWSEDQNLKLQEGLKGFGKTDPERWVKIAEGVPGKTKKEVVTHALQNLPLVLSTRFNPKLFSVSFSS